MEMFWFWSVAVVMALYAILDGFDFGAGILHLFVARTDAERRQVLAAIGPWWDGNEVWLLAGGGVLFLAFPKVLAASFSGFYLAMFLVIWCLLLRGISIEFRSHLGDGLWRAFWDGVFALASAFMPVLLGAALGNVVRGVPLDGSGFFNIPLFTHWDVQNPVGILDWYTVLMGLFVLAALACHGALYLAWKTDGPVRHRSRTAALRLWTAVVGLALAATIATARVNPDLYARLPHAPLAWVGLALYVGGLGVALAGLRLERDLLAFAGSSAFILGILVATAACVWPVMLRSTLDPRFSLDALNASAGPYALRAGMRWWIVAFVLALGYFAFLGRVHRGKVQAGDYGHE
ncbi:cytochrome d ubiquinol oxidase subunit II [Mesoterricola sediminis]|uniref:Cytochrome c oxidase assembly protein n=1 Tax=Mesoterricola sediminis TaxID=2927980 RepID=A0AA48GM34_9BACT|nr:cytochrome d ubiquinol oxidase subunit II [Mesoterricola sediminis]BDU75596.1 cytochrome c oxidase assembly protein [Mesoterricola sediminis]